jgi:glycine betaine/proline transport system substrate-binding protein
MRPARWMAILLSVCALCWSMQVSAQQRNDAAPVRLGQISLSFYAVTGGVVQEVLERLGHTVEITQGTHAQIFPRLGSGEVDLLVAAWLPHGHATYWAQYGDRAEPLAKLYEGARFAWMVPTYVPEAEVAQVDDLKKPDVLARMDKTIQGTGRDSGNTMLSGEVLKAYGLDAAGYRLVPGAVADFHGAYDRGIAEQRWFVMPLWWPHYINRVGSMRPIEEPRHLLGPPSTGTLVAAKQWVSQAPHRTVAVLRNMHLGLDAVAEMDYLVNVRKMTPRDAARGWMQNNARTVDRWFEVE